MQCLDAHALFEQGVFPSSADAVRTMLGFHLAGCPDCRAYRAQSEMQRLLESLLATPALAPISSSIALGPNTAARPAARAHRSFGAALLIASALAVPLGSGTLAQATSQPTKTVPQRPVIPTQLSNTLAVSVTAPAIAAAAQSTTKQPAEPATDRMASTENASRADFDLNKRSANVRAPSAPERPALVATTDWAVFAPTNAADVARSQITAFEQAGPQQLPQQLLQLAVDDAFASVPLEVGQTLFLPEDPPAPPEPPPPAVFVPAESLPLLPAAPAATRPQPVPAPKPAPKPATKPAKTQQAARTYTVQPGDTLTTIALRSYGDAARWRSIYDANRSVIGSNPNLIRPNQKLVVPALQPQGGTAGQVAPSQRSYTVRSGDTLSAIALEFYGDGNLWPLVYSANKATIGNNPDLIFPQQRLAVPGRTQASAPAGSSKPAAKPAPVKATGKLSYTVAKGDSLRGLAKRVYGDESRWQEIYHANRTLIPDADRLQIGITLAVP